MAEQSGRQIDAGALPVAGATFSPPLFTHRSMEFDAVPLAIGFIPPAA
jgi:hypothetical protein